MCVVARVQTYRYRPTSDAKVTYQSLSDTIVSQGTRSPPRVIILTVLDVVMVDVH
jgi:hypothetical protein